MVSPPIECDTLIHSLVALAVTLKHDAFYDSLMFAYRDTSDFGFEAIDDGPQVVHTITRLMCLCHYKINNWY